MSLHIDMQVVYSCQQLVPSFVRKGMKEWRGMLGHRKPRLFHEYLSPSIHFSIMDRLKVFVYMSLRACVFVCESACVLVCVHRCVCIIVWARRLWLVWAWGSLYYQYLHSDYSQQNTLQRSLQSVHHVYWLSVQISVHFMASYDSTTVKFAAAFCLGWRVCWCTCVRAFK